uniref:T cell receptor beta variable 5-6 n=1 Tax=Homo sapiens TaxID=9606 RepID=TVB56_HUMAN
MGPGLLCWALLCLLGAGLVDAGVTQSPTHLIKTRGQQVTLRCSPKSGHDTVSWYQQALGQGPQFIFQYYEEEERQRGNFPDRFSGHQFPNYSSELNVNALLLGDSALYLCASSL